MQHKTLLQFLKISSFLIFAGRAYQHLFWDAPYRSIFWDQQLLEPIITKLLALPWQDYVTNLETDRAIQLLTRSIGVLFALCALIAITYTETTKRWNKIILKTGSVGLVFLAFALTKEKFYHLSMFFEHSIQFGIPIALVYFVKYPNTKNLITYLKVCIALAFTCHGMYALGILYPIPANFVTMTLNILPVTEEIAKHLLFIAGILDVLIAIGIFIPKMARISLWYACFWGFITALARILEGYHYGITAANTHQYLYLVIYRLPHGLVPLAVYWTCYLNPLQNVGLDSAKLKLH